jgi:RNA polymerase sigma-70 factor (ECF subfamily)
VGEERYRFEPADHRTPEALYDRRWALTLLEQVMGALEQDYRTRGKQRQFELLRPCLAGAANLLPYPELARQLALSESAARVAMHRFRRRYADLLLAAVASTLDADQDPRQEIQRLIQALGGPTAHMPPDGKMSATSAGAV